VAYTPPPPGFFSFFGPGLNAFMKSSFGVFHGDPVTVKIWFSHDIAGYISEKIWHETQNIEPQEDGSILFTAEVAGTDEIKFWILNWGAKAIVLEPQSLRDEIRSEAAAMLQQYSKDLNTPQQSYEKLI